MSIRAIVTDIEGTTTDVDFVHQVLFPYSRRRLAQFVRTYVDRGDVRECLDQVRQMTRQCTADVEDLIGVLDRWIGEDRKATPLKTLQGMIWRHGYENGDFRGHVYADASRYLKRWHAAGIQLFVYSSGSVAAQKLLFGYSDDGDLTSLFSGYFDTRLGAKQACQSYRDIVQELALPAQDILFLSDTVGELDAASAAGIVTYQLLRKADVITGGHPVVDSFEHIPKTLFD